MEMRIECGNFDVEVTSDIFSVQLYLLVSLFFGGKTNGAESLFLQAQHEHVE